MQVVSRKSPFNLAENWLAQHLTMFQLESCCISKNGHGRWLIFSNLLYDLWCCKHGLKDREILSHIEQLLKLKMRNKDIHFVQLMQVVSAAG